MKSFYFLIFLLFVVSQEKNLCTTVIPVYGIYPTTSEQLNLDLSQFFVGTNLTFSQQGAPSTSSVDAYGYIVASDEGKLLPENFRFLGAQINLQQKTEQWNGQVVILGLSNIDSTAYVYYADLGFDGSPSFDSGSSTMLMVGRYLATFLPGLVYIADETVLVDSYYATIDGGVMQNQWQLVSTVGGMSTLPLIIPSSNKKGTKINQKGFGRISQYWSDSEYNRSYVFRGTLNNAGGDSYLEIFKLEGNIPSEDPVLTIDNNQISQLQMTDFYVQDDGQIWILNSTNCIIQYELEYINNLYFIIPVGEIQLNNKTEYLSIDIEVDYRIPKDGTYSVILTNTDLTNNVEEYVKYDRKEPFLVGYYTVPVEMDYDGNPPQIDINNEFVSIQYSDQNGQYDKQVYLFQRGTPSLNPNVNQIFQQNSIVVSQFSLWASLNDMPSSLLSFTVQNVLVSQVQKPSLSGNFGGSETTGQIIVSAYGITGDKQDSECQSTINFTELPSTDTSIQYSNPSVVYQVESYFPINSTFDVSKYLNGPAIDISGTTMKLENQLSGDQDQPFGAYASESLIVPATILPLQVSSPSGYPANSTKFVENAYNSNDESFLQFIQSNNTLYIYICYQGTYDVSKVCYSVGSISTSFTIQRVEALFPISTSPYAYFFTQTTSYDNTVQVYQLLWDKISLSGKFEQVNNIECTYMDIAIIVTDYAVVDQQLYVTLNEINQVWEYEIETVDNQVKVTRSIVISNELLQLNEGFSPMEVIGNYDLFGPCIFVNNYLEVVIISVLNNSPQLISVTKFPLTAPGLTSNIKIAGDQLIVVQTGSQTLITQFSLTNLYAPVKQKNLPLFNQKLKIPLEIDSDGFFFYAVINDNSLNVYKPSAASHECLFQQLQNADAKQTFMFSATSDDTYSYITLVNSTVVTTKRIQQHVTAIFVPGQYNNQYFTKVQFNLQATNRFNGTSPLLANHSVEVFNSQIQVEFNQAAFQSANSDFIFSGTGQKNYSLNTSPYISGSVAEYSIECDLCSQGNVTIMNRVTPWLNAIQIDGEIIINVNAMASCPFYTNSSLVQTTSDIFLVDNILGTKLYSSFPQTYHKCNALTASNEHTFSFCQSTEISNDCVVLVSQVQTRTFKTYKVTQTIYPVFAQSISQTVFVLGTNVEFSTDQTIQIYSWKSGTQGSLTYVKTLTCPTQNNNGVNDMDLTMLNTYTVDSIAYAHYLLLYTCKEAKQTPYFVDVLVNNSTGEVQIGNSLPLLDLTNNNLSLLVDTSFYQIQTIFYNGNGNVSVVLQTSNIMNFVLSINFQISNTATIVMESKVNYFQVVTTLPPYGKWVAINALSYADNLLILPYTLQSDNLSFIALFDLSNIDYQKENQPPHLMVGGLYAPFADNLLYQLPRSVPKQSQIYLLTASSSSSIPYNLSSILLTEQVSVNVNIMGSFPKQIIKVTASNYYVQTEFNTQLTWVQPSSSTGVKWWGWMLIVMAVIIVIGLGGYFYFFKKNQRVQESLLVN